MTTPPPPTVGTFVVAAYPVLALGTLVASLAAFFVVGFGVDAVAEDPCAHLCGIGAGFALMLTCAVAWVVGLVVWGLALWWWVSRHRSWGAAFAAAGALSMLHLLLTALVSVLLWLSTGPTDAVRGLG